MTNQSAWNLPVYLIKFAASPNESLNVKYKDRVKRINGFYKNWALDGAKASNVKIMIHQLWMAHESMTHADSLWFNDGSIFDAVFWFIVFIIT